MDYWTVPVIEKLSLCVRCHHAAGDHHPDGCHWYDRGRRLGCSCTLDLRARDAATQNRLDGATSDTPPPDPKSARQAASTSPRGDEGLLPAGCPEHPAVSLVGAPALNFE
jgi:hypothetical protein